MLISHVRNEVNKNTCSIILTFDKLCFGNTMSSEAKNAYCLCDFVFYLFCFSFPLLHKWYENDNNLLLLMQDNFVSKSWQTSLRKLLITNCQNVSKTVKFHTQHTIDIMTKNVCLSCLFLFFEPPTKSSCPRSHWWVSSTPFGIPFRLPFQF